MPIYAYKCAACGHAKDVLQKLSDAPLSTCPVCGAEAFTKQVTAAGFQLKGSGWYVTDFRNNAAAGKPSGDAAPADGDARPKDAAPAEAAAKTEAAKSEAPSTPAPVPAAAASQAAASPTRAAPSSPAKAAD